MPRHSGPNRKADLLRKFMQLRGFAPVASIAFPLGFYEVLDLCVEMVQLIETALTNLMVGGA